MTTQQKRSLRRSRSNRMIAGVCGGLAEFFGISAFWFRLAFIVAFIVITVLMGVRQVPQGFNYTVERFGRYYKTLTPGLGLIFPYIDSIGRKLNLMEQVVDVPRQEIAEVSELLQSQLHAGRQADVDRIASRQ